jgi:hypothetical protein
MAPSKSHLKRLRHIFSRGARADVYDLDGVDLDLVGFGFMEIIHRENRTSRIVLTDKAINLLHELRQADIANRSIHHDLGARLAKHLRDQGRATWENIEFKNLVSEDGGDAQLYWKVVRPDVFSIVPSLNIKTANPCVYEVKVSRADFMRDMANDEKRLAYAMVSEAVYYVVPDGLVVPSEIPKELGLIVEKNPGIFVLAKKPRKRPVKLEPHHFLNLILKPGNFPESALY